MNTLIKRLIDCGMTRAVALTIYRRFRRDGRLRDFEQFVEEVEQAQNEQMDPV